MKRRHFITASSAALAAATIPACKPKESGTGGGGGSGGDKTLTIFTWADYLSPEAKAGFEKAHGCKVVIDTFDSNEAMLAKLEAGATGYDVLFPSSYTVQA